MPIKPANTLQIKDEGVSQGFIRALDFVGASIAVTVSGTTGTITASAAGGTSAWTKFTQSVGVARRSGTFDITGLSGLTTDNVIEVVQTSDAVASKGNARDEPEMDQIVVTAFALGTTSFRATWFSANGAVVVGTYAFAWR